MAVVVTGGAGFLGQHIVKLLHQTSCKSIRIFDKQEYKQSLDFTASKPVEIIVGDICSKEDLHRACTGAQTVIHAAGLVDFSTFPDMKVLHAVNVLGTENVIAVSKQCNIQTLVFTSTVDVVVGNDDIENGDESLISPDILLWQGYAETKLVAERMVCNANGSLLANGSTLSTVSIRPNVMYGDGDPYFVYETLKAARMSFGTLPRIGNGRARYQSCYAGNMAWAHIKAMQTLNDDRHSQACGQALFVPDDTPICNTFDTIQPFLNARGYSVTSFYIPYFLVYYTILLVEALLSVIRPVITINLHSFTSKSVRQLNIHSYFQRKKAELLLDYKPYYTYQQALELSIEYYTTCKI